MTQDNPDKPQPAKTKPKTAAKSKAPPVTQDTTQTPAPDAAVKPHTRKPVAPEVDGEDVTALKTAAVKRSAPKTTTSKSTLPKTTAPKTTAPKTTAPKTTVAKANTAKATTAKTTRAKTAQHQVAAPEGTVLATTTPKTSATLPTAPQLTAPQPTTSKTTAAQPTTPEPITPKPTALETTTPKTTAPEKTIARTGESITPTPRKTLPKAEVPALEVPVTALQVEPLPVAPAVADNPEFAESSRPQSLPARSITANKSFGQRAAGYWQLMRMHRPIGTLLLLWPTLWALWLAAKGMPRWDLLVIFVLGVIVMRSAGCVINDFADRKIDGQVKRTKDRPLVNGAVSAGEAIGLFSVLCLLAFGLVLLTDKLTIQLSVGGLLLAFCYPFMKRYTHLPQVVLGAAFAWSVPMAFAAQSGNLGGEVWLVYTTVVLWTVVYDTFYAMVDRDDDRRIGVKSTAILFGEQDRMITGILQLLTLYGLAMIGSRFELGAYYYASLVVAAGLFAYQQYLIRLRERDACFKAFLNNNWVGAAIFAGILFDFLLRRAL